MRARPYSGPIRRRAALAAGAATLLGAPAAHATFLSGEALDAAANAIALFVLFAMPIGVIVLFWLIHILPEKIAEKRHHPQKDAIKTLCLLSLVFGGMLWPLAWLWAYTKPVFSRMAYGTDKHDDFFVERGHEAREGKLLDKEIAHLRQELDSMAARGKLPDHLEQVRRDLDALAAGPAHAGAPAAAPAPAPAPAAQKEGKA